MASSNAHFLSSVINAMSDLVRVIDKKGDVKLANDAFLHNMGEYEGMECYKSAGLPGRCAECISKKAFELNKATYGMRKIGKNIYSVTASPIRDEEGNAFAVIESFRDITEEQRIKARLLQSNKKMQKDLDMARKLQHSLVRTDFSDIKEVKISAGFYPCEAVGGDIYGCIKNGNKLVAYVCDVSGHGVMPAIMAVFVSGLITKICQDGETSPKKIFEYVCDEYRKLNVDDNVYVTAFAVCMDVRTGETVYSGAGISVLPLVWDEGELKKLELPSNPISKWFDNPFFEERTINISKEGRLLLYTDGIEKLSANKKKHQLFLDEFSKEKFDGREFLENIKSKFENDKTDDLTMVVLDRKTV